MSFVTPPPLPTYSQVDFALTIGQEESFLNAAFDFTDGLQPIQHVNDLLFDFHFPPPSFELMRQNVDRLEQVKAGQLSIDDWIDALPEPLSQSVRNPSTDAQRKVMERLSQSQRQLSPEPTNAAESNQSDTEIESIRDPTPPCGQQEDFHQPTSPPALARPLPHTSGP